MKKLAFTLASLTLVASAAANVTVDFADKPLPANSNVHNVPTVSNGTTFSNSYFAPFDSWSGFAISNVNDTTTPGFGNQYAAITGTDVSGAGTYAVAYENGYISLPNNERPSSVRLTNTTYAALSMRDGDSFGKKFGGASGNDADFLSVTFTGYAGTTANGATTGATTFFLADYRFANNASDYIVTNWASVDLTALGNARSIGFSFASSDTSVFDNVTYINTPTYFALDNLQMVPEPTTLAALAGVAMLGLRRRRGGGL